MFDAQLFAGLRAVRPVARFPYHRALPCFPSARTMKFNLKVPFAEKDAAKALGARWDAANKLWYVEGKDMAPFAKWSPTPREASAAGASHRPAAQAPAKSAAPVAGITIVGSKYVAQPRVCDCLPWDVCDKCRATALS